MMMKKIVFLFLMVCWAFAASARANVNIFAYSREAPDTKIYDSYGRAAKLSDFKGNFVIAVFWSKTCVPCLREMKELNSFANKTKDNGVKVILVSSAKDWASREEQVALLHKYGGDDLDFYIDKGSALANEFGIFTSPHAVLINSENMEIGRIRGAVDWDDSDVEEYIYKLKAQN